VSAPAAARSNVLDSVHALSAGTLLRLVRRRTQSRSGGTDAPIIRASSESSSSDPRPGEQRILKANDFCSKGCSDFGLWLHYFGLRPIPQISQMASATQRISHQK
jgi:hypothetical protein